MKTYAIAAHCRSHCPTLLPACRTLPHTAALPRTAALSHCRLCYRIAAHSQTTARCHTRPRTLLHCRAHCHTPEQPHIAARTAAYCRVHCNILPCALLHPAACTTAHGLSRALLLHIAACTATHCRTLPHVIAIQCRALPHTAEFTSAHCRMRTTAAHCRTTAHLLPRRLLSCHI
jgi:hypothetical protein